MRLHFHPPKPQTGEHEVLHRDVQRGHAGGLLQELLDVGCRGGREVEVGQAGKDAAGGIAQGLAVFHIAVEFVGIDVGAPLWALAVATNDQIMEAAATEPDLVGAQGQAGGQVVEPGGFGAGGVAQRTLCLGLRCSGGCGCGCGAGGSAQAAGQHFFPGVDVQLVKAGVGLHTLDGHDDGFVAGEAHGHTAAQHARHATRNVAFVLQMGQRLLGRAQGDGHAVGAGQFAAGIHQGGENGVFVAQGQALGGGLAQWCGQLQLHALQVAVDHQLGHTATEPELGAVGGHALGIAEQVGDDAESAAVQALGAGRALATEPDACRPLGAGLHAALKAQLAAVQLGLRIGDRKAALAEADLAGGPGQPG